MKHLLIVLFLSSFQSFGQTSDTAVVWIPNTLLYSCDHSLAPDYTLQVHLPLNCIWKEAHLIVYNRWADVLYDSTTIPPQWDANAFAEKLDEPNAQHVFIYHLTGTFTNGQVVDVKGNILLMR